MRVVFQIDIPRRGATCTKGQESFLPLTEYYSVLVDRGDKGFIREDYCPACWKTVTPAGTYWKSVVPASAGKELAPSLNREQKALEHLKDALQRGGEQDLQEAFILSLFLARRRWLALRKDLASKQIYELLATEEFITVPKVQLSTLQSTHLQQKLKDLLK